MSRLNSGRKLFYLAGVTLLGGHIIIMGDFGQTPTANAILEMKHYSAKASAHCN